MESIKRVKRTLKRANTFHAASKNQKKKQETSTLTPSTFFKKRLLLSYQCNEHNIPQEIYRYIQQLLYISENEKLLHSGTFGKNWQAFGLNPSDYHCLNEKQFIIIKSFLTSTPYHLPSQKVYKEFLKIMPASIKTCLANDLPDGIRVFSKTAAQGDIGLYMITAAPKNSSFGLTLMPIFPEQTKKKIKKNNDSSIVSKFLL